MELTPKQAAEYLKKKGKKISPGTLSNMRVKKTGPTYIKVGASVRYRSEDLDLWLAEKKTVHGFSFRQYLFGQILNGLVQSGRPFHLDEAVNLAVKAEKEYIRGIHEGD